MAKGDNTPQTTQQPETLGMEQVVLQSDNGTRLEFSGRVFSETSFFDEERGCLTRMRLFVNSAGGQVYSIAVTGPGIKERRHYTVQPQGAVCAMSDGQQSLTVPIEMLFASVFGLCGIDTAREDDLRSTFAQALRFAIG